MVNYPSSTKQFVTKIDKNTAGEAVGPEYFNVPTVSPYSTYLDHVPKDSATTVIGASGGATWTEVDVSPTAASQYLVDYTTGEVTFFSSNSGAAVQATYQNLGDDIMAEHVNDIQDEIMAIENELGANPSGPYSTIGDRITSISASGTNGNNIADNTIRAGALMDDIKGASWATIGRPTLESNKTDLLSHTGASSDAHDASAISCTVVGSTTGVTVQEHIASVGVAEATDRNPHGLSLDDVGQGFVKGNIAAVNASFLGVYPSGHIIPVDTVSVRASGSYSIGTIADPWASGNFDVVQSTSYMTGESVGTNGQFISSDAKTVTVLNGIIVSIV